MFDRVETRNTAAGGCPPRPSARLDLVPRLDSPRHLISGRKRGFVIWCQSGKHFVFLVCAISIPRLFLQVSEFKGWLTGVKYFQLTGEVGSRFLFPFKGEMNEPSGLKSPESPNGFCIRIASHLSQTHHVLLLILSRLNDSGTSRIRPCLLILKFSRPKIRFGPQSEMSQHDLDEDSASTYPGRYVGSTAKSLNHLNTLNLRIWFSSGSSFCKSY